MDDEPLANVMEKMDNGLNAIRLLRAQQHKNNSRKIWQVMKKIVGKEKTKSNVLPKTIKIKDKNLYNEEEIAYEFNTFFTSVGSELAKKFLLLIRNLKST